MELWGVDQAVDSITRNGLLDLTSIMSEPDWLIKSNSTHTFSSRFGALERARGLAALSVNLGEIKDPDSPSNWVAWARKKGYSVDHLHDYCKVTLPEKMPRTAMGKIVIEVASGMKAESGIEPTAKQVIAKLKSYAQSGEKYSDVLRPPPKDYRRNGVYWTKKDLQEKEYTLEACEKTLKDYFRPALDRQ